MRRPSFVLSSAVLLPLVASACGGTDLLPPPALPPVTAAPLTTTQTVRLKHAVGSEPSLSPSDPAQLAQLLAAGWGDTDVGPGLEMAHHTLDGAAAPTSGAAPKLLVRFAHLADTQLADDESPARLAAFDAMGATNSAYRPHEAWGCRVLNAAMRTLNKIHETTPIEMTVLGGDNIDNAQLNELDWFVSILDGSARVECDSGRDDDPVPGPQNDPKDPFAADGLVMPWRWVTGNHDVLFQGSVPIADKRAEYLSDQAPFGTRDWSLPNGPLTTGTIVPDLRRAALDPSDLTKIVGARGDGHGLPASVQASGKVYYSFDAAGGKVRFIALDTCVESNTSDGVIRRSDMETIVKPMLQQAEQDGVYVILLSHHAAASLGATTTASDPVTTEEWRDFLGGFPHVIMHLGAHSHRFAWRVAQPTGHRYFEAETGSLADWPTELRLFEIWDEDNGFVSIRGVPVDYAAESDPTLAEARRRAAADYTAGWIGSTAGPGEPGSLAVTLWFPKP